VALSQFCNHFPAGVDVICNGGAPALAVGHQSGINGGSQLGLRTKNVPQQHQRIDAKDGRHVEWPAQNVLPYSSHESA